MRCSRMLPSVWALCLITLAVTTLAFSQGITTGTVSGTVFDPLGAVIPGAQVQLINQASGLKLAKKSTGDGSFKFFAVPIGTYSALITAGGFSNEDIDNIHVVAGATTNLNEVRLHVASAAAEEVEVNGSSAALLETSDSQVTTTFGTETMQNLPLNNGFDTVVELIPGVVATGDDNFSNTNGDNYSVNGQSGRYNNFEIDGQSNNDNSVGGPQVFFGNQDAIQQLQVITNDYSAQYGRNAGAVENYITKSGTNSFHGTAFDLYQSQFLSSLTNSKRIRSSATALPVSVRQRVVWLRFFRAMSRIAPERPSAVRFSETSSSFSSAPIGTGSARARRRLNLCLLSLPTRTRSGDHRVGILRAIPALLPSQASAHTPSSKATRSPFPCRRHSAPEHRRGAEPALKPSAMPPATPPLSSLPESSAPSKASSMTRRS